MVVPTCADGTAVHIFRAPTPQPRRSEVPRGRTEDASVHCGDHDATTAAERHEPGLQTIGKR